MRAVIVFAHGSRDPLWRQPVQAVAQAIAARDPSCTVRCAYLELCTPDLPSTIAAMAAQGITQVGIVPMFLGTGRHAREDLPRMVEELSQAFPQMRLHLSPPIGEDERMTALMARIAAEVLVP